MTDFPAPADPRAYVRSLCRHHATALVLMASVLLDDIQPAGDIVATALADACRSEQRATPDDQQTRQRLARSVYHRCLGHLAVQERFPHAPEFGAYKVRPGTVFGHLSTEQRALMTLAIFGGHDITQIAHTLRRPVPVVVEQLTRLLPSVEVTLPAALPSQVAAPSDAAAVLSHLVTQHSSETAPD